jgi:GNAT superfamily N-acetyltransferase
MDAAQLKNLDILKAGRADLPRLRTLSDAFGARETDYFERQLEYQSQREREMLLAVFEGTDCGYAILNWQPKYVFFKKLEVPEIQDLNILPAFRRRGIATAVIGYCEARARARGCAHMGIGVGLYAAYGPAQRLYVKLGYVPDGNGITYDRRAVAPGEIRPVDDQLSLMMVKDL